jgi:hypothetical protein
MKLFALFATLTSAQITAPGLRAEDRHITHDAHPTDDTNGAYEHVDKYTASDHDSGATVAQTGAVPNGVTSFDANPNTGFAAPNTGTCPVSCVFNGDEHRMAIKVQHETQHDKLKSIWNPAIGVADANGQHGTGGVEPGSVLNKIFHRCYHREDGTSTDALAFTKPEGVAGKVTGQRQCICECAKWSYDSCAAPTCPQTCGFKSQSIANPNTRTAECKFHSRTLSDDQCIAVDKDLSCPQYECPDAPTQTGDVLASYTSTADWDGGDNGRCTSVTNRLVEKGNNINCKWVSPAVPIKATDYNSLDISFRARGINLENSDFVKIRVQTCRNAGSFCTNWKLAKTKGKINNFPKFKTFLINNYAHTDYMRSFDNYLRVQVELATNKKNEQLQLDVLKIKGQC